MVVRRKMMGLQLLFVSLLYPPVIVAEDLDPFEFLISKNYPKNKSLIPLPKNFDKFGDQKNGCCALQLFIEVKDYNGEGTGNGDGYSDNESQTETCSVTFNFEHPSIRKSDIKFTMSVEKDKDKVKSKHLLNFDNCTNIEYKTFNISATTTIADDKDVRVVLVNGKDAKIVCTDPNLAPEPREDRADNVIVFLYGLIVVLTTGWLLTLLIYNYRKIKKICSNTYIKLTTSQKQEVINLSGGGDQSESAAPRADSDSETSKDRKGGEVKEKSSRTKKRDVREKYRPRHSWDVAPGPRSTRDVSTQTDSDNSDEERVSVNNIKSSRDRTRGKKTSTEGVDKCGWITKIWKTKPLFFNVVVTCVWFVLSAIIVGIVFIL